MSSAKTQSRKKDHLRIATSSVAQTGDAGFGGYRFVHNALPEINYDDIDISTKFLGKEVKMPFFISCMTGGVAVGKKINRNLAQAAEKYGIAMGVGSQRAAIEDSKLASLFLARKVAPSIPLIANVGLVQLNYGFTYKEMNKCVDMIGADALAVHINPIQEVIQPEGDRNFADLLPKLADALPRIKVPVIAKEVGFGLSPRVIRRLYKVGIRYFDTAGWGGTSWAVVEGERRDDYRSLGRLYGDWGIPSSKCIADANTLRPEFKSKVTILGSGGVRTGVDVAKALALGADLVGIAMPFALAAQSSYSEVCKLIEKLERELRVCMFGVGAANIDTLKHKPLDTV